MLRSVALEIARATGADAMPVWREYARMPGFGAYARQWLATQVRGAAGNSAAGALAGISELVTRTRQT